MIRRQKYAAEIGWLFSAEALGVRYEKYRGGPITGSPLIFALFTGLGVYPREKIHK